MFKFKIKLRIFFHTLLIMNVFGCAESNEDNINNEIQENNNAQQIEEIYDIDFSQDLNATQQDFKTLEQDEFLQASDRKDFLDQFNGLTISSIELQIEYQRFDATADNLGRITLDKPQKRQHINIKINDEFYSNSAENFNMNTDALSLGDKYLTGDPNQLSDDDYAEYNNNFIVVNGALRKLQSSLSWGTVKKDYKKLFEEEHEISIDDSEDIKIILRQLPKKMINPSLKNITAVGTQVIDNEWDFQRQNVSYLAFLVALTKGRNLEPRKKIIIPI